MTDEKQVIFENMFEVTKESSKSKERRFPKVYSFHFWIFVFMKIVYAFIFSVNLYLAIVYKTQSALITAIAFFVLFIYSLIRSATRESRDFKKISSEMEVESWVRTFRFGEEKIEIFENGTEVALPYNEIRYISEYKRSFLLWYDTSPLTVYKDLFTIGDVTDFRAFINEKCSEKRPLLTRAKHNLRTLKSLLFLFVLLIVLLVLAGIIPLSKVLNFHKSSDIEQLIAASWGNDIQIVSVVDISGGVVVFATEGTDKITASLLGKSGKNFYNINSHGYSVTLINNYNKAGYSLFESEESYLSFASGDLSVIYGVAEAAWWRDTVSEYNKQKYTTVGFKLGIGEFILYYRIQYN